MIGGECHMRIEWISANQFSIYLTFDDLVERGFTEEDLWHDATSVQNLFSDMMYEASSELGFELEGMLLVQVHLMQSQGMHIIVTQQLEDFDDEDYVEMKVTLDESKELIFAFAEFEDIIQVSSNLQAMAFDGGKVYYYHDYYYMLLDDDELNELNKENLIAIMAEYSQPSIITSHRLEEYGKCIYPSHAVKNIIEQFYK